MPSNWLEIEKDRTLLMPSYFFGKNGCITAVSSNHVEPTPEILPFLEGNILIFGSWNTCQSVNKAVDVLNEKQNAYLIKVHSMVQICTILKRRELKHQLDAIVVDRVDLFDTGISKMKRGSMRNGVINELASMLGEGNAYLTCMGRIAGLFELADDYFRI